jgi:hypothetical protein
VWSERKHTEKLRYMPRNPVKRGLVERPEQWRWSSFRSYLYGEVGPVRVNYQEWPLEIERRRWRNLMTRAVRRAHSFAKTAKEWGTRRYRNSLNLASNRRTGTGLRLDVL